MPLPRLPRISEIIGSDWLEITFGDRANGAASAGTARARPKTTSVPANRRFMNFSPLWSCWPGAGRRNLTLHGRNFAFTSKFLRAHHKCRIQKFWRAGPIKKRMLEVPVRLLHQLQADGRFEARIDTCRQHSHGKIIAEDAKNSIAAKGKSPCPFAPSLAKTRLTGFIPFLAIAAMALSSSEQKAVWRHHAISGIGEGLRQSRGSDLLQAIPQSLWNRSIVLASHFSLPCLMAVAPYRSLLSRLHDDPGKCLASTSLIIA